MKNSLIFILLFLSTTSHSVVVEIKQLCKNDSFYSQEIEILAPTTAGHLTIHMLEQAGIDFLGNENGISGLLNTPTGLDSYEVISDNHMRAYGWCYSVDGSQPNVLASEYPLFPDSDCKLTWFYGYAEMIDNEWISYCKPVYLKPNSFVCSKN